MNCICNVEKKRLAIEKFKQEEVDRVEQHDAVGKDTNGFFEIS